MNIRPERPADHAAVAALVEAAFGRDEEARLVERLRASSENVPELALVAEDGNVIAGHVMFSYSKLSDDEHVWQVLQLSPLAVAPERQGQGIGGALVRKGLELCDARGEPLVVLLGHPGYYPRFGFEPAASYGIQPPHPAPASAFMVAKLTGYDPKYRGRIAFAPAFDEA